MENTPAEPKKSLLWRIEDLCCWVSLAALALLPAAEMLARVIFKTGVPASSQLLVHILLILGLVSGMITTRQGEHLSIAVCSTFPAAGSNGTFLFLPTALPCSWR